MRQVDVDIQDFKHSLFRESDNAPLLVQRLWQCCGKGASEGSLSTSCRPLAPSQRLTFVCWAHGRHMSALLQFHSFASSRLLGMDCGCMARHSICA